MDASKDLLALLQSRRALIWAVTPEESRIDQAISDAAAEVKASVRVWSIARGFHELDTETGHDGADAADGGVETADPIGALQKIATASRAKGCVWVLRDFQPYLTDPGVRRWLREIAGELRRCKGRIFQSVIVTDPRLDLPPDLSTAFAVVDWPLPTRAELGQIIAAFLAQSPDAARRAAVLGGATVDQICDALAGLTATEAADILARSFVGHRKIHLPTLLTAKREIVRKSGHEYIEPTPGGLATIGGLSVLKGWAKDTAGLHTPEARAHGAEPPSGVLCGGPPGTGKSAFCRALATAWGLPLLRLDVGALMGSLVGESEANWRAFLKLARALAPVIVWVDEIDRALAGHGTDTSGVTTRMVGAMLIAMQEQDPEHPITWVATSNAPWTLPAAMLRAGRFDSVWSVDLPTTEERAEIAAVHLDKRGRNPEHYDLIALAQATTNYSGAEIEQVIKNALVRSYADGRREPTDVDLFEAAAAVIPLARTMPDDVIRIRQWAKGRARPAGKPEQRNGAGASTGPGAVADVSGMFPDGLIPEGGN